MVPEEVDESNSSSNGDSSGGTGALLGLTRKLRATLLENKQSYERDLKALKQQLEQQSEALASSAKEAFEVEKVELRLAGVNKLVAASKAKCERLEAQLTESQAKYSALETRIASATEQLLDKDREIAVLREQILENTKTGSEAEASLQQSLSNLAVLQISLSQTQEELTTARAEIAANLLEKAGLERALGELQRQIEQVEQNNIHSIGDYEEALETMRQENEHLCERIRTLECSLTELKTQTDQGDDETIEQLRASQARVASYQETIRAATEENAELRATLEDLQSNQKELAYLKDRIAHDLAEVRKKGSARLNELELKCREIQNERNGALDMLKQLKSELVNSTRVREQLQSQLTTTDEADAENRRLKQRLVEQFRAIEAAELEAKKAKAEVFESRQKVLEAYNQAESVEFSKTGRVKAERRAEEKEREVAAIKAQLAESQRKFEELQNQMQDLRSLPSAASLSKFIGRITGPLRTNSSDEDFTKP